MVSVSYPNDNIVMRPGSVRNTLALPKECPVFTHLCTVLRRGYILQGGLRRKWSTFFHKYAVVR